MESFAQFKNRLKLLTDSSCHVLKRVMNHETRMYRDQQQRLIPVIIYTVQLRLYNNENSFDILQHILKKVTTSILLPLRNNRKDLSCIE